MRLSFPCLSQPVCGAVTATPGRLRDGLTELPLGPSWAPLCPIPPLVHTPALSPVSAESVRGATHRLCGQPCPIHPKRPPGELQGAGPRGRPSRTVSHVVIRPGPWRLRARPSPHCPPAGRPSQSLHVTQRSTAPHATQERACCAGGRLCHRPSSRGPPWWPVAAGPTQPRLGSSRTLPHSPSEILSPPVSLPFLGGAVLVPGPLPQQN